MHGLYALLGVVLRAKRLFCSLMEIVETAMKANLFTTLYLLTYKTGWDFAEEINENMNIWDTLISLSIVKGLYKSKEKAEEYCYDANAGSQKETEKAFLKGLGV